MHIACYIRNPSVLEQVKLVLQRAGFTSAHFASDTLLLRGLRREQFDLVVIDFAVAPRDDDSILSWLTCRSGDLTPVLGLSPTHNPEVTTLVLNCGADDMVVRPFDPAEFTARVQALLRRCNRRSARRMIELAGFSLDRESSRFAYKGEEIELTPREFSMAWLFFSSPGIYISRETIGTSIWSADSEVAGRTIEQHVYKLRKKLFLGPERGVIIRTAYSQGYRLELSANAAQFPSDATASGTHHFSIES